MKALSKGLIAAGIGAGALLGPVAGAASAQEVASARTEAVAQANESAQRQLYVQSSSGKTYRFCDLIKLIPIVGDILCPKGTPGQNVVESVTEPVGDLVGQAGSAVEDALDAVPGVETATDTVGDVLEKAGATPADVAGAVEGAVDGAVPPAPAAPEAAPVG